MKLLKITAAVALVLGMGTAFAAGSSADKSLQVMVVNTSSVSLHRLNYTIHELNGKYVSSHVDFFVPPALPTDPQSTMVTITDIPQNTWADVNSVAGGADDEVVGTFTGSNNCQMDGDSTHQGFKFADTGLPNPESVSCAQISAAK